MMENMLEELSFIVPPSSTPGTPDMATSSKEEKKEEGEGEGEGEGEVGDSMDSLAVMRRRLAETVSEASSSEAPLPGSDETRLVDKAGGGGGGDTDSSRLRVSTSMSISVQPPTPTTPSQRTPLPLIGGGGGESGNEKRTNPDDTTGHLGIDLKPDLTSVGDDLRPSTDSGNVVGKKVSQASGSPGKGSPHFSPASCQNSPDTSKMVRTHEKLFDKS